MRSPSPAMPDRASLDAAFEALRGDVYLYLLGKDIDLKAALTEANRAAKSCPECGHDPHEPGHCVMIECGARCRSGEERSRPQ